LNNGFGGFGNAQNFPVGPGPASVAVGDFNGDGHLDLTTANTNSNDLSVLLGDGTGNFGPASFTSVGSSPVWVAVGDFNGSGSPDLVTANSTSGTVSVLLNQCSTQPTHTPTRTAVVPSNTPTATRTA